MSSTRDRDGRLGSGSVLIARPVKQPGADGNGRKLDPEGTKREILQAARTEFAEKGFSGARVDEIGARTRTAKRMIYYYFGSKDGLYMATLEHVYADIRAAEATLDLDTLSPKAALCRLVDFTFDYHERQKDFVRILAAENMNGARYLKQSEKIRELNSNVLESVSRILARGREDGSFHRAVEPVDLYMMISALCFFRISNGPTFSEVFGCDLSAESTANRQKQMIKDAVLAFVIHSDSAE
jgi:AcrR family transcriptional regulator